MYVCIYIYIYKQSIVIIIIFIIITSALQKPLTPHFTRFYYFFFFIFKLVLYACQKKRERNIVAIENEY